MSNINDFSDLYGEFSSEAAQEQLDALKSGGDFFKIEKIDKPHQLRVMPPEIGRELPWVTVSRHFFQLPGFGWVSFNCPRLMSDRSDPQRCPGCEKAAALAKTGNPSDAKLAEDMAAGTRAYCKVIDRANPEAGVQVYDVGVTILRRFSAFRDADSGLGEDFTHPVHGCDVIVTKHKKSPWYTVDLARKASRLAEHDEQIREWLVASNDMKLDRYQKVLSFDEIVALVKSKQGGGDAPAIGSGDSASRTAQDAIEAEPVSNDDEIPF